MSLIGRQGLEKDEIVSKIKHLDGCGAASSTGDVGSRARARFDAQVDVASSALAVTDATAQLLNPVAQYLATLQSPHSKRMMMVGLRACLDAWFKDKPHEPVETFPWWEARYEHTNLIRSALAAAYSPPTANLYLAALRGVLKTCWKLRLMTWEGYGAVGSKEALPAVKGSNPDAGRRLTRVEQTALYAACERDATPSGRRDAAVLAVLFDAGLRRSELAALRCDDIDRVGRAVVVRAGKGKKSRRAPLTDNVERRVGAWLDAVRRSGRGSGPLFTAVSRAGKAGSTSISGRFVATLLAKRASGVLTTPASPHDTRRTFATDLSDAGVGLERICHLLGHASIETTRRYLKLDARADAEAVDTMTTWRDKAKL